MKPRYERNALTVKLCNIYVLNYISCFFKLKHIYRISILAVVLQNFTVRSMILQGNHLAGTFYNIMNLMIQCPKVFPPTLHFSFTHSILTFICSSLLFVKSPVESTKNVAIQSTRYSYQI